jgi:hypothetical protein
MRGKRDMRYFYHVRQMKARFLTLEEHELPRRLDEQPVCHAEYVLANISGFRFLGRTDAPGHACPQKTLHPSIPAKTYLLPHSLRSVKLKLYKELLKP